MDPDAPAVTGDWTRMKEAVADFRQLLLCAKCSTFMKEPVCLGACEHVLCRSCTGPRAGDRCAVCHSPAWVKDIQINRHLSNVTQLFHSLESLLNPPEGSESCPDALRGGSGNSSSVLKHKKTFKIWFSPRSRKVRCKVEKPLDAISLHGGPPVGAEARETDAGSVKHQDLMVFNFHSSSQDSCSSGPQECKKGNKQTRKKRSRKGAGVRKPAASAAAQATQKQTQAQVKKQRMQAINQQWGIGTEEEVAEDEEQPHAGPSPTLARRFSKRVSFLSPVVSEVPGQGAPQENPVYLQPNKDILQCIQSFQEDQSSTRPSKHDVRPEHVPEPCESKADRGDLSSPKRPRVEQQGTSAESTPKRMRASPGFPRSPKYGKSPRTPRGEQRRSPISSPGSAARRSPCSAAGSPLQGSPPIMKRNHKGETPLHLAAIKGDVDASRELLDQGADPNLKDNAGWTPLHEACNLGHQAVVEVLLSRGALLNTPGYENDSPLHDAVRNGHPAIARLLLQHGASQNVLNQFGKRPADYAVSPEMQEVFKSASDGLVSPPTNLSTASPVGRRDEPVLVLASKLSVPQKKQLAKLSQLLGVKTTETFSTSVSHVVVPVGPMPTTLSSLQGVLAGCWVLTYSWVEACLEAGEWAPETDYEAGEAPRRSRINRRSLLPPLFDGCFFFLLGSFRAPPRDELVQLLRQGGGRLLSRQPKPDSDVTQTLSAAAYHAPPGSDQALCTQYILYDPRGPHRPPGVRRGKVWSAPSTWLVDCIAAFRLLPVPER